MEVYQFIFKKMHVAFGLIRQKSKMQQPFKQARFLTNDPVINYDMLFLTNLGAMIALHVANSIVGQMWCWWLNKVFTYPYHKTMLIK